MKLWIAMMVVSGCLAAGRNVAAQARTSVYASEHIHPISKQGQVSFGIGAGFPYGGLLGVRVGFNVADRLHSFAGVGHFLVGAGFNIGLQYDFAMVSRTSFYVSGMAGSNAATYVEGASQYNKVFYGPSFGTGLKVSGHKNAANFWQFGFLVPIRSAAFREMIDDIKKDPNVDFVMEAWPVAFTVGYNLGF